jgi:hypothetical protein
MNSRSLVLALLLVPMLLLGAQQMLRALGSEPVVQAFDSEAVARVELARGDARVLLERGADGGWIISSAADAPADAARVSAALSRVADLRGRPVSADEAADKREPLTLRLSDANGRPLAEADFWALQARARPAGPQLAIEKPPALPLWPSAWSSLKAPRVPVERIAAVEELSPRGPRLLPPEDTVRVARILADLTARDFVAGGSVGWGGARMLRVRLTDGSAIDLQQVPDGDGRYHLRLTSDKLESIRAARRYAFRVAEPLP